MNENFQTAAIYAEEAAVLGLKIGLTVAIIGAGLAVATPLATTALMADSPTASKFADGATAGTLFLTALGCAALWHPYGARGFIQDMMDDRQSAPGHQPG